LFVVSRDVVYRVVCYLGAGGEGQFEDLREQREKKGRVKGGRRKTRRVTEIRENRSAEEKRGGRKGGRAEERRTCVGFAPVLCAGLIGLLLGRPFGLLACLVPRR
jgi:hypothetical protein